MQDNCSLKHKNNQNLFLRDIFIALFSCFPLYVGSHHNHHFVYCLKLMYRELWCVLDNIQSVTDAAWSSLVIFMLQTVQGAPWHLILLWIYNLDNQKSHTAWEAAAPRQGHPCVIRSIKFQFTSSIPALNLIYVW